MIFLPISLFFTPVWFAHGGEHAISSLTAAERIWLDRNPEKLTLLFNIEFPPLEFASPYGTFTGMGADIIAEVEKKLGVTFLKKPSDDWNEHISSLKNGACAVAPTIVDTSEGEQYAFFTKPYTTVPVVIITTRTIKEDLDLDDLSGRKVAVVSGYATETYLRQIADDRIEIVPVSSVTKGLSLLSFGRVDAFAGNLSMAAYAIEKEGISNLRMAGSTDYSFAFSIGISRKYPLLFSAIQKALDTIPQSEINAIRSKWIHIDTSNWQPKPPRQVHGMPVRNPKLSTSANNGIKCWAMSPMQQKFPSRT